MTECHKELQGLMDQHVSVVTNDGRTIFGTLKGLDQKLNVILEECKERVFSKEEGDAFGRTFVRVVEPRVYFLIADVRAAARGLQLLPAAPGVALNQFSFSSDCDNALPPLV